MSKVNKKETKLTKKAAKAIAAAKEAKKLSKAKHKGDAPQSKVSKAAAKVGKEKKSAGKSPKSDGKKTGAKKAAPKTNVKEVHNVFTAIGLEAKHRSVPFQLVRHYDEVTVVSNKTAFPYICEEKYDGNFCAILVRKGVTSMWSRTGNEFNNLEVLKKQFKAKADGFYITEVYAPKSVTSLEKFSGIISPFRKNALTAPQQAIADDKSMLAVHDYITIEEFSTGKSELSLTKRKKRMNKLLKLKDKRIHVPFSAECKDEASMRKLAKKLIKGGAEGIVIKGKENPYTCGHQNFHFMKIVKGLSFDLKCVGSEEGGKGTKREGQVTNLIFKFQGDVTIKADLGKGYTDKDRTAMLKAIAKGKKGKTPIGAIFEVYALEEGSKGALRLPKVGELRHDKKKADY